jgi:hypothetical protein
VVFCPNPLGPKTFVWAASIDGRPAAHSRTDYASKRPNPSQILRASVRTSPRLEPLLANRHSPFRRQPRCNGTLRRNGTRLLSTITSIGFQLEEGQSARPRTPQEHPEPGVICLQRSDDGQDGRTRPPNSSSQCFQKLQCFWLQSMDCRFGQYIPVPMAFCAIGYRTWVARMSGSPTV